MTRLKEERKDLIVLVADKTISVSVQTLLSKRYVSLGIRQLSFDIYTHPQRDPGCRCLGIKFLRPFADLYKHALLMFDFEGCGEQNKDKVELKDELDKNLADAGWNCRACTIVFVPEFERWIWVDSPYLEKTLNWDIGKGRLKEWLIGHDAWRENEIKPVRPKEALELVLRTQHMPRSSSLYADLAGKVTLKNCRDETFIYFRTILKEWFERV
jgi:hypothetical protein